MGSVLCRQREGPWVYGVASPSTPPSQIHPNPVRPIPSEGVKADRQGPVQLALRSPTPTMPAKPSRVDSVDPIRSAITSMGGWGEPGQSC
jgi:hypothetical protein